MTHDDDGTCTLTIINPIKNADRGRYEIKAKNYKGEDSCFLRVWFRGKDEDDTAEKAEYRRTQKMYKSRHVKPRDEDEWPGDLYHSKRLEHQKEYNHRYKLSWLTRLCPQTLAQGSTLKLTAFVDGKFPQYDWYHEDMPLVHGRKYRQVVTKNGKGCLIINNAQPKDSGLYKLVVKNYANSIDCEANITVYAYEHKNFEPPLFTNLLSGNRSSCTSQLEIEFYRISISQTVQCRLLLYLLVDFSFRDANIRSCQIESDHTRKSFYRSTLCGRNSYPSLKPPPDSNQIEM